MLQLLKTEWLKVKNYTTFWVLSVLYFASVFGATFIAQFMYDSLKFSDPKEKGINLQMFIGSLFEYPNIWHTITYAVSFMMFILGLMIITSITNEFSYKTHRQNIIDGWSRSQFILVKILLTVIISIIASLMVFITVLIFGYSEGSSFDFGQIEYLGYFFIQALAYTSAALLISLLLKRPGITFAVYLLYCAMMERILVFFLNKYANDIGRFMPLESSNNLIRNPIFETFVKLSKKQFTPYNIELQLLMSIVYLGLFYFISYRKFQTDDL